MITRPEICTLDFESHLIKPGMPAPKPVCLAMKIGDGESKLYVGDQDMHDAMRRVLVGNYILVGHNISFDLLVACASWPSLLELIFDAYDSGRVRCTQVRQQLIDIARGEDEFRDRGHIQFKTTYKLDALINYWFDHHLEKDDTWRLRYGELDDVPLSDWPIDARTYPLGDTDWTARLFGAQGGLVSKEPWAAKGQIPDELPQTSSDFDLALISAWGFRTDGVMVAALRDRLEKIVNAALVTLRAAGLVNPPGSASVKNMQALFARVEAAYKKMRKPVPMTDPSKKFPKGQIKTAGEVLLASGDDDLILLGNVGDKMTLLNTFVPTLERGTRVPICVSYNVLVNSGRTSARKPNVQNLPRIGGARECVVPRDGRVFIFCDYDTIELRMHAQNCLDMIGYSILADAFQRDMDPHLMIAAQILGITYEVAKQRLDDGDDVVAEMRQLAKPANYGFPGGMSAASFVEYAHNYDEKLKKLVDLAMAERLHKGFFTMWSENPEYFKRVGNMIGPRGGTQRQLVSGRVRGQVYFTEFCNGLFQGRTADGTKAAMKRLVRECYMGSSALYGSRPVIFMHDEFGMETDDHPERAHAAAQRLALVMREEMQRFAKDVPIKCGPLMMRRWNKGAKPVLVNGLLRPSKPVHEGGKTKWVLDEGDDDVRAAA